VIAACPTRRLSHTVNRRFRRYSRGVLVAFGVLMVLALALNTWTNPLWITKLPWSSAAFDRYKPIHKQTRIGKAGIIRHGRWEGIFLGSSRVDIAFDPLAAGWQGKPVANLALRGGMLFEHLAMLRYAADHQPLDLAIIGIDLADLTSPIIVPAGAGYEESPLSTTGEEFEKYLRYYVGSSTLTLAIKTIDYRVTNHPGAYTPQGHWIRQYDKRPLREVIERESFRQARQFIGQRKQAITLNPAKLETLRAIIGFCRQRGIRLILCIPPNHAAYLCAFRLLDDPDPGFRADRATMARIVAEENNSHPEAERAVLWDFNDFHPFNCEPLPPLDQPRQPTKYWTDGTHALPALGNVMLARMMGWPLEDPLAASYGVQLDPAMIEARLTDLRAGYERYRAEHPDDYAWVASQLITSSPATASIPPDGGPTDSP
jgi:hypothetical protein